MIRPYLIGLVTLSLQYEIVLIDFLDVKMPTVRLKDHCLLHSPHRLK